jgi:hypothetical protein
MVPEKNQHEQTTMDPATPPASEATPQVKPQHELSERNLEQIAGGVQGTVSQLDTTRK